MLQCLALNIMAQTEEARMANDLFRKKSLERISSPEELNDYIKVANPAVWMVLTGIVLLLAGVIVWSFCGYLDTRVNAGVLSENGTVKIYITEDKISEIEEGMKVVVEDASYEISYISDKPIKMDNSNEYLLHVTGLKEGQWVYEAGIDGSIEDGAYQADIIVQSVNPISFVLN